jgi:L-erythro-3,5-diaminohexanoate dehydrogenase
MGEADPSARRRIEPGGDAFGTHRVREPRGSLPQPAEVLDNDFTRLFEGELLLSALTLNLDAASFAQIDEAAGGDDGEIAHIVLRTVAHRGKQHNPVTGSGGMLLGRVIEVAPPLPSPSASASASPASGGAHASLRPGDPVVTLVSLTLTPLRLDRVRAVRRASAQLDVDGEAVLFASGACARLPADLPERLAVAVLDVAGAAPQVARLVGPGAAVVVLGAGGKSGMLCVAEARRRGGPGALIVGVEPRPEAARELTALGWCDAVVVADARDAPALRRSVLAATGGREADLTISCVNVPDAEAGAILCTRERGAVYFFAMSTSFTRAALGAEGLGKDVDLFIGNGYAAGHAEHTLALLRDLPELRALFERRYAT